MNTATFNKNKSELAIMSICDFAKGTIKVKQERLDEG
jgi:hypothetical protein